MAKHDKLNRISMVTVPPPPGEELIYLDPHTTQPSVEPSDDGQVHDDTYHCQHPPCRMHICELDPSIAAVRSREGGTGWGRCDLIGVSNRKQGLGSVPIG